MGRQPGPGQTKQFHIPQNRNPGLMSFFNQRMGFRKGQRNPGSDRKSRQPCKTFIIQIYRSNRRPSPLVFIIIPDQYLGTVYDKRMARRKAGPRKAKNPDPFSLICVHNNHVFTSTSTLINRLTPAPAR